MSKIDGAIYEIHHMDTLARRDQWGNHFHPLVKLMVTVVYIVLVVSFSGYDVIGLSGMAVYPLAMFILAELSWKDSLRRLRIVLPLVCAVGLVNPFLDTAPVVIGTVTIRAGVLSMITLMEKGALCVFASYLLIATTPMEDLCYALRLLHVPKILVTQFMLTYRYISVLLEEGNRMTQAYLLRAPGQKGIHIKVWGPLLGQLLLRSMDRAEAVYESMLLRGYNGNFRASERKLGCRWQDAAYLLFWCGLFILLRKVPVLLVIGNFAGGIFG